MSERPGSLQPLFMPHSVAIIGASADAAKIGGRPVKFLKNSGYRGDIYPVNPKAATIQGLPAFAHIGAIPGPVDHAIIAVPASGVVAAVKACAEKKVRAVTIFSGGFAELDDEGVAAERKILEYARAADMRVVGPNCVGTINAHVGLMASFMLDIDNGLPPVGRLALISQSGAVGGEAFFMARERGLPLGTFVTTGNECDVDIAECISYFAQDTQTDVIMCYMEGCKNPAAFIEALDQVRKQNKRIIILKSGKSSAGAAAAQSHTGKLAGNYRVYQSLFAQYGVVEAQSFEQFFDIALLAMAGQRVKGRRVAVFTVSGGVGTLMADAVAENGLELPQLPAATQEKLKELIPIASVSNPVDGTAQVWADWDKFHHFLHFLIAESDWDCVVLFFSALPYSAHIAAPLLQMMTRLRRHHPDQMIIAALRAGPALQDDLRKLGYIVFDDPARAISAFGALARRVGSIEALPEQGDTGVGAEKITLPFQPNEYESTVILAKTGLPVLVEKVVHTVVEAKAAASELGFPVVLKLLSPDLVHQSETGGVVLDIRTEAQLEAEYSRLETLKASLADRHHFDGMIVAPMVRGGVEMILGVQNDPVFGPIILVGFGGIFAEILDDVALRLAPVSVSQAKHMVRNLKAFALLDGARGRPRLDIDALAEAISRLSVFGYTNRRAIKAIDVNPFIVLPEGRGGVVLDGMVIAAAEMERG